MKLRPLALARGTLDRAANRRSDEHWLATAWAGPRTRVLVVNGWQALVRFHGGDRRPAAGVSSAGYGGAELVLVSPAQAPEGIRVFLGVDSADVAYFAVLRSGALDGGGPAGRPDGGRPGEGGPGTDTVMPAGLREAGALLADRDAGLLTHAVALANWHFTHEHCPRCGARTDVSAAGHTRTCARDGSEHFPRVDPAVIMLVLDPDDRCLLARNRRWPEKRVSILAGFVEPGESVEQAVAREVREEVGITVGELTYLGSQPWPLPRSLMLGFSARALVSGHPGQAGHAHDTRIQVDDEEIIEAGWYSRDGLRQAIGDGQILLPPPVSIAHRIIEAWFGEPLPTAW